MKLNNETRIGILVVVVTALLFWITWKAGDFDFAPKGYAIKIHFLNTDGIEKNAPVTLNGKEVGRVQDIQIIYEDVPKIELTLWIDADAKISRNSKALIKNLGFMGEKYVGITMATAEGGFLENGEVLKGKEPVSFENLLEDGQVIAQNLKEISVNINERLKVNSESIDGILADMRASMGNINSITANVNERLATNEQYIDGIVLHLNNTSQSLEEMSYDLKENPWKLLYRPKKK